MIYLDPMFIKADDVKVLKVEFRYWISTLDLLPLQFTNVTIAIIDGDTKTQIEKFKLNKYDLDILKDDNIFSLKSLPLYYKLGT